MLLTCPPSSNPTLKNLSLNFCKVRGLIIVLIRFNPFVIIISRTIVSSLAPQRFCLAHFAKRPDDTKNTRSNPAHHSPDISVPFWATNSKEVNADKCAAFSCFCAMFAITALLKVMLASEKLKLRVNFLLIHIGVVSFVF